MALSSNLPAGGDKMNEGQLPAAQVRLWRQRLHHAGWGDYLEVLTPVVGALGFVVAQVLWLLAPFDAQGRVAAWAHLFEQGDVERIVAGGRSDL